MEKPSSDAPIASLKNLGPASAQQLAQISIYNYGQLKCKGAIPCYALLLQQESFKPSFNLLYAMLGAIDNRPWQEYRARKGEILIQLESFLEIDQQF